MAQRLSSGEKPAWNTSDARPGGEAMDRINEASRKATMRKENRGSAPPSPSSRGKKR